jgi:hypothetical protein
MIWKQELEAELPEGAVISDVLAVVRVVDEDGEEYLYEAGAPGREVPETMAFAMLHWSARNAEASLLGETEDQ